MHLSGSALPISSAEETAWAVRTYFRGRGYRERDGVPYELRRGSLLGTLTALSPRKWAVVVRLAESDGAFTVDFDINTTGHILTEVERAFWRSELEGALGVIAGRTTNDPAPAERRAASLSVRALKLSALYSLGAGAVALLCTLALDAFGFPVSASLPALIAGLGAGYGLRRAIAEGNAAGNVARNALGDAPDPRRLNAPGPKHLDDHEGPE